MKTHATFGTDMRKAEGNPKRWLFDNLPTFLRPGQAAEYLGISVKTIYDWRYRGHLRGVPHNLFLSHNRRLLIRTDILMEWIASQNPELDSGR